MKSITLNPNREITVTLDESQRQLILMALGALHTQAPGFDWSMNEVAKKLKGESLYEDFKVSRSAAAEALYRERERGNSTVQSGTKEG